MTDIAVQTAFALRRDYILNAAFPLEVWENEGGSTGPTEALRFILLARTSPRLAPPYEWAFGSYIDVTDYPRRHFSENKRLIGD